MYENFYGLKARPFSLLPDPSYLFLSRKHETALSILEYAVNNDLALSVVTGEVGSGKTTLVRQLMHELADSVTVGLISNTHRSSTNLMRSVALAYDIPFKEKDSLELYQDFTEFLIAEYAAGRRTLLIVDEAQNLDAESLEEIRLLTNINSDDHTLLQLLLVGQPELHDLLKRHDLRQLAQRISVMSNLEPLDEKETADYVKHRIEIAGGDPKLFHKNALRLIYRNSGGIPRVINTLCELALVYAYADRKRRIDALLIADIARDRIDTGLYGEEVYDMRMLKAADEERARARKAARGKRDNDGDEKNGTETSADISAMESEELDFVAEENKIIDITVDSDAVDETVVTKFGTRS